LSSFASIGSIKKRHLEKDFSAIVLGYHVSRIHAVFLEFLEKRQFLMARVFFKEISRKASCGKREFGDV